MGTITMDNEDLTFEDPKREDDDAEEEKNRQPLIPGEEPGLQIIPVTGPGSEDTMVPINRDRQITPLPGVGDNFDEPISGQNIKPKDKRAPDGGWLH